MKFDFPKGKIMYHEYFIYWVSILSAIIFFGTHFLFLFLLVIYRYLCCFYSSGIDAVIFLRQLASKKMQNRAPYANTAKNRVKKYFMSPQHTATPSMQKSSGPLVARKQEGLCIASSSNHSERRTTNLAAV